LSHVETTIGLVCGALFLKTFFKETNGAESVESCKNLRLLIIWIYFSKNKNNS